eukprot:929852-Lingulodinium_polyedra.AAC.1
MDGWIGGWMDGWMDGCMVSFGGGQQRAAIQQQVCTGRRGPANVQLWNLLSVQLWNLLNVQLWNHLN